MHDLWLLLLCFGVAAFLYSSVGHGGASGYLAVMAFAGWAPAVMRPTALTLNIIVSLVGMILFFRAGYFRNRLFYPLVATSIPCAWLGGWLGITSSWFKILLGITLLFSASKFFSSAQDTDEVRCPPVWALMAMGGGIGLLSGLIGIGGGVFLTPLLLHFSWAKTKEAAALSAPFIFVNSLSGLLGKPSSLVLLPEGFEYLAVAVLLGGFAGSSWGSYLAKVKHLRWILGLVLLVASVKLIFA